MVKRSYNLSEEEPNGEKQFAKPSEREHLFQVVDIYTCTDEMGQKLGLDMDTVSVKCEVLGGDEAGLSLLVRCTLDEKAKGFFATRLFLKVVGEPYKGEGLEIDTDRWVGRQFYGTVTHNGKYANISEYNFEKMVEQKSTVQAADLVADPADIKWEE